MERVGVTEAELKRLDKQIRRIQDPLGAGLLAVKRILKITADQQITSVSEIIHRYVTWKWRK